MFRLKLFANFVADSRDFVLLACEVVSSNATSKIVHAELTVISF